MNADFQISDIFYIIAENRTFGNKLNFIQVRKTSIITSELRCISDRQKAHSY